MWLWAPDKARTAGASGVRRLLSVLLALLIFLSGGLALPGTAVARPSVHSAAFCLIDQQSGQVLLGQNQHQRRSPASTTKMVTALLVRSYADLNEPVTISARAAATPSSGIGIRKGQTWMVDDLLKASLVKSANDASVALAEHVAGSQELFAHLMTKKAMLLGAFQTTFANASGFTQKNHLSTAYDLAIIGRAVLADSYLAAIVSSPRITINHPGYQHQITINNTNRLLSSYPGLTGIKTGTTNRAGQCLVASASRDGKSFIAVALKSRDRYGDCRRMLEFAFAKNEYMSVWQKTDIIKWISVNGKNKKVGVRPARDVGLMMAPEERASLQKVVVLNYSPFAPIRKGMRLGTLRIYYQEELVDTVPLVAAQGVGWWPW